uniref:L-iditol 2-dehydrogenase n=1 Tax=Candidatus Kentrum sp. FM TaxID=2126340 RepID=A0A450SR30_9GAMM|nr:MAG: L-iditol 2-dehydrogenase [Candidatus Kentron sp. FM]VFJ56583.1 MAG: L-iditol 2-dehydrogenase [Candidatus Kentron sp. FM]VFK11308.1 MAG: L-iditol 2-dehydrogenase [Candidatus Kentron sp. FM]
MKVGMYYNNSDVRPEEQPVPTVGDTELLIKVMASAICGSDLLEWYRIKRAPLVLGHELTGEIVEAGKDIESFRPGDRVFTTHHVPCDECYYCLTGHETACKVFQEKNNFTPGGFSQYLKVGGRSVKTGTLKLPDNLSFETGTFIEPLGTVVRAFRTLQVRPGESMMILGAGLAGILFVKLARALGVGNILVSDINEYRLEMAKRAGASFVVTADRDLPDFIQKNNGRLADKVIICTGALSAAESALRCVDKGGTVLFFAVPTPGEKLAIDFNPYWRDDIGFKTCYGSAPLDSIQAMELLRTGAVTVDDMITHRFGIDGIGEAFKTAAEPAGALKVIVKPNA